MEKVAMERHHGCFATGYDHMTAARLPTPIDKDMIPYLVSAAPATYLHHHHHQAPATLVTYPLTPPMCQPSDWYNYYHTSSSMMVGRSAEVANLVGRPRPVNGPFSVTTVSEAELASRDSAPKKVKPTGKRRPSTNLPMHTIRMNSKGFRQRWNGHQWRRLCDYPTCPHEAQRGSWCAAHQLTKAWRPKKKKRAAAAEDQEQRQQQKQAMTLAGRELSEKSFPTMPSDVELDKLNLALPLQLAARGMGFTA